VWFLVYYRCKSWLWSFKFRFGLFYDFLMILLISVEEKVLKLVTLLPKHMSGHLAVAWNQAWSTAVDRNLKCLRHRFIFWYMAWFKLCILVRTVFVIFLPFLFQWCSRWRWLLFDFWHHLSFDLLLWLFFTFRLSLDARFFLIFGQTRFRGEHPLYLFCYFCNFFNHSFFHLSRCPNFHWLSYA